MQELREGTRLADRYALSKRLGAGGMAEIWLARDERAEADVALKILLPSLAAQTRTRELFHNEWSTSSRLMHAHIVRSFEYHDEERPFYVLQFIDGPDIGELAGERLPSFLPAIGLIADALRYAHGKGIVHRDIKASNVLLDQQGSPYLIDFGIGGASSGGTPATSSPEQRAGQPASPADDIYSLGVLLHELLAGRPPSSGLPLPATRENGESIPTAIASLLEAMLSPDAASRPSAEQVVDRLDAAGFARASARLPASLRRVAGHVREAEISVRTPAAREAITAEPASVAFAESGGLSKRTVYTGLAVLLALLIGVTVLLPGAVDRDDPPVPDETAVAEESASGADAAVDDAAERDEPAPDDVDAPRGIDGDSAGFSENLSQPGGPLSAKRAADNALGRLLSVHERLKTRGIERWGGQGYLDAMTLYREGDEAYIDNNYPTAADRYSRTVEMLDPFFDRIDGEFRRAMTDARAAFERRDASEAVRLFDLAVAITPGHQQATAGLERARNLSDVLDLMDQGRRFLEEEQLDAARIAFRNALDLDPLWEPAQEALASLQARLTQLSFESRMSEGFEALAGEDFASARVAFEAAGKIFPSSPEPADGLLQVDQEERLFRIQTMEVEAQSQEAEERWETAVATYEALLEVDGDLAFAKDGLARSRERAALHRRLQAYVDDPDSLSDPANLQNATQLMLGISRMDSVGPRLEDHKNTLARLLKRAATPLAVEFVSDNATDVLVYRVGRLGMFARRSLELRPGQYVAVGSRPGFRDVRQEFRVAPEIDMQPIVVQCEEPI